MLDNVDSKVPWPDGIELDDNYHGLPGSIVQCLEEHTEADPAALLAALLVAFGNALGRTAHMIVDGVAHYLNENVLIVGPSSTGRKGAATQRVMQIMKLADPDWARACIRNGLCSGEGLIWSIRDSNNLDPDDKNYDPGVADKRLLAFEPEFSQLLINAARRGSTLSTHIRTAWDAGRLETLGKSKPASVAEPHVSLIGNVTLDDLAQYLSRIDCKNGFANRFLYVCARRSRDLPFGGELVPTGLPELIDQLRVALHFGRSVGLMSWHESARTQWEYEYCENLNAPATGLAGHILARAQPHVMRLACIYALLDQEPQIKERHLRSASDLWWHSVESVKHIFGDATGNRIADDILAELRHRATEDDDAALTRDQIRLLFHGHKRASEIDQALRLLEETGRILKVTIPSGGRPTTTWLLNE